MCGGDFVARRGDAGNPGLLDPETRLASIEIDRNPYVTGSLLAANSPVFAGRSEVLHQIISTLRRPDKPGCVSLLGERRIGKSSLLIPQDVGLREERPTSAANDALRTVAHPTRCCEKWLTKGNT